jgi:type II secretory pathway pseudopilin PulG
MPPRDVLPRRQRARRGAHGRRGAIGARRRERGVALLFVLLVLMLAMAGVLLAHLESAQARLRVQRDEQTTAALAEARAALIAYALSNPDAPGQLPYPDRDGDANFDGESDCVNTGTTVTATHLIGRFPIVGQLSTSGCASLQDQRLDLDLRDGDGERLWYAVAPYLLFNGESYELPPGGTPVGTRINTGLADVPGAVTPPFPATSSGWLVVYDAQGNVLSNRVAAVIIAPGAALEGQGGRNAATPDADQYLDEVDVGGTLYRNHDTDRVFISYPHSDTTAAPGDLFNDRLVYITVDELMPKVEQRVLAEVSMALNRWRTAGSGGVPGNGRFPWLSPVANVLVDDPVDPWKFSGVPGTRAGYLPFIDVDVPGSEETYTFDTGFTVTWTNVDADVNVSSLDPLDEDSGTTTEVSLPAWSENTVDNANLAAFNASTTTTVPMPVVPAGAAQCQWLNNPILVDCFYSTTQANVYSVDYCVDTGGGPVCPSGTAPVSRTTEVQLSFRGVSSAISSNSGARARDVDSGATLVPSAVPRTKVTVTDTVEVPAVAPVAAWTAEVERELDAQSGDQVNFVVTGLYYEPRSDGSLAGDLPDWFSDQRWGPYVYVSYANNFLPAEAGSCTAGTDCLSLVVSGGPVASNVAAIALAAGAELAANAPPRSPATGAAETSFFEDDNADADDSFDSKVRSATFDDRARIVATFP